MADSKRLFITGTDTDVGKTFVACKLLEAMKEQGYMTAAIKPVAAGSIVKEGRKVNEDAIELMKTVTSQQLYEEINPILFDGFIAPHIAAEQEGISLSVKKLKDSCSKVFLRDVDVIVCEGAGGWFVPINDTQTMADYVESMSYNVILVVGIKLGCINHALLTAKAIKDAGCSLVGWVANHIDPHYDCNTSIGEQNRYAIEKRLGSPLLATFPYSIDCVSGSEDSPAIDLSFL